MRYLLLSIIVAIIMLGCSQKEKLNDSGYNVYKSGSGGKTIVLVSGLGESLVNWKDIQADLEKDFTVISYDRPGLGRSPSKKTPRTIENHIFELDEMLQAEGVKGPITLVGHSYGGFIARGYTNSHPDKVTGLFLIDPSHEKWMDKVLNLRARAEADSLRSLINKNFMSYDEGPKNEFLQFDITCEHFKTLPFNTVTKTVVLCSLKKFWIWNDEDMDLRKGLYKQWEEQSSLLSVKYTKQYGHYIHNEAPKYVLKEIRKMVDNY